MLNMLKIVWYVLEPRSEASFSPKFTLITIPCHVHSRLSCMCERQLQMQHGHQVHAGNMALHHMLRNHGLA